MRIALRHEDNFLLFGFKAASTAASELSRPTESGNNNPGKRIVFFSGRTGSTRTSFVAICFFLPRKGPFAAYGILSNCLSSSDTQSLELSDKPNTRPCSIDSQLFRWDRNENVAATSIYQEQNRVAFCLLDKAFIVLLVGDWLPIYLHDDISSLQGLRRGRVLVHAVDDNTLC